MVTFQSIQNFIIFLILFDMNKYIFTPATFFYITGIVSSSINKHAETLNMKSQNIPNLP